MGTVVRFGKIIPEECCFECKDGGEDLRVCDSMNCLKSYHPDCTVRDFPPPGEQFICNWHTCVSCRKASYYQCLCCPNYSVCHNCLGNVEFYKLGEQNKGLCTSCFDLAISIEKNTADPQANSNYQDSDIGAVLFKDYWSVVKDREHLTLVSLEAARATWFHDRDLRCTREAGAEKFRDEDLLDVSDGNEQPFRSRFKSKPDRMNTSVKRKRSKGKTYVGWGTKELIEFLSFLGKDIEEPLGEVEVVGIVKEYIKQKGLFLGDKKKHFECDDNLRPLFTRRNVRYNMLHSKLRVHLASNAASEDESLDGSEADDGPIIKKKPQASLEPNIATRVSERNKRCLASLNEQNINLIYLRRSLVIDLSKHQDTFEQKVVGCFVRVKNNSESQLFQMSKKPYHLGQVTGIKKSEEKYKIKDTYTDIILCISGFWSDVKISMLSEENIEEDEFIDLIPLGEKGLLKRATIAEFEQKVAAVHADIVNHWIDTELKRLESRIDLAHENGWRQEMHELMDRKKLLSTPAERQRRLEEIPEIDADAEDEKETELNIAADHSCQVKRGKKRDRPACLVDMEENSKEPAQPAADTIDILKGKSSKGLAECASESFEVLKEKAPEGLSLVSNHISHSVIGRKCGIYITYQRRRKKADLVLPGSATKSVIARPTAD